VIDGREGSGDVLQRVCDPLHRIVLGHSGLKRTNRLRRPDGVLKGMVLSGNE
jgi:hypothetical protein